MNNAREWGTVWRSVAVCGVAWLCAVSMNAQAQQPQTGQPSQPNQPIELPEFIVTGKESVNIPGGTKREPVRPPVLRADKLDSLNPIEKLPLPRLPAKPLPEYKNNAAYWPGWVQAEFGNYITPKIAAGYSLSSVGYLIDIRGDLEASSGWVENTEYLTAGVGATSTYVAPEKFLVLSGSTTVVDVDVDHRSYNLYAQPTASARTNTMFKAGVGTRGAYDGVRYAASFDWRLLGLTTSSLNTSDNSIIGAVELQKQWKSYDVGGALDVRLRSYGDSAYPFTSLAAKTGYNDSSITLSARAGAQWAGSTSGSDRFGALVQANGEFRISPQFTFNAGVQSGLRQNSFFELLRTNPYVADSTTIDASYDLFDVLGVMMYHPTMRFSATVGINIRSTDRDVVWMPKGVGLFTPEYRTTSSLKLYADVRWKATSHDAVVADVNFINATVSDAAQQPYIPSFQASAGYDRMWSDQFQTVATIVYVGDRWSDLANTITLSGYVDVRLAASYRIGQNLRINARADNLIGSSIVLWQGYRERGIFISTGITYTF